MTAVRLVISAFVLLLVAVSVAGLYWTGHHQPAAQAIASGIVLSVSLIAAVVGLALMWRQPTA
jgi:membrane protein YdbS with pleckstrin-like domain